MGMLGFGLGVCKRKQTPANVKVYEPKKKIVAKTTKSKEAVKTKVVEQKANTEEASKQKEVFTRKSASKQKVEEKAAGTKADKSYWNF